MNKLMENIIEITMVYVSLAEKGMLRDEDSLTYKQYICQYAEDFERETTDIEWDGGEHDYYIEIEEYGKRRLLKDFAADPERKLKGSEITIDTKIGELYAFSGDNGINKYMEIGVKPSGIDTYVPICAIETPSDEKGNVVLYTSTFYDDEYDHLELVEEYEPSFIRKVGENMIE